MNCAVPGCVVKSWGHVGPNMVPHAATQLTPYSERCTGTCSCGKPCVKANGHDWSCNCHVGACHAERGEKVVR